MSENIFLDYNATTPMPAEIIALMNTAQGRPLNASSVHSFGRQARSIVERARDQIAALINAPAAQIIFNSGATEGNNTVLKYFANERILASAIEHPAVLQAAPCTIILVHNNGTLDLSALETLLKSEKTALVSVMLANNETGIIQPIREAATLAHSHGALFHCDAVQAAGRIEIDMIDLGIDFLTLSAHKIGGPQGVGALALGICGVTPTLLHGGGQEKSARAGTENIAAIAGFGLAAERAKSTLPHFAATHQQLHAPLKAALTTAKNTTVIGEDTHKLANTTLFLNPDLSAQTLLMALDLEGIAVSNGAACSSGKIEPSHVLKAMGYSDTQASSAIRISTGWATTEKDIAYFIEKWQKITNRMKA